MRAEGYGPFAGGPIAVVTRSCRLDWSSRFFTAAAHRPIVVTVATADAEERQRAAEVADVIIAGDHDVDVVDAIAQLHGRGFAHVLIEGGPQLNGDVVAAGLVDEVCLTMSPELIGGDARRILSGASPPSPVPLAPVHILEADGFLFLRYARRR
jgi:riboflavin biosynthesis pyrimidine reductase